MGRGTRVEARGQLPGVGALFPPCRSWGVTLRSSALVANMHTGQPYWKALVTIVSRKFMAGKATATLSLYIWKLPFMLVMPNLILPSVADCWRNCRILGLDKTMSQRSQSDQSFFTCQRALLFNMLWPGRIVDRQWKSEPLYIFLGSCYVEHITSLVFIFISSFEKCSSCTTWNKFLSNYDDFPNVCVCARQHI